MPTDVEITVIGLCLCFRKEDKDVSPNEKIWNLIFPCDDRHTFSFEYPTPNGPKSENLSRSRQDVVVDFLSNDSVPQPADWDGATFGNLLNLADDDLHGKESAERSNLRVQRRVDSPENGPRTTGQVLMRVPRATLFVHDPDLSKDCYLVEVDMFGTDIDDPITKGPKSERVMFRFRFEGKLTVRACLGADCSIFNQEFPEGQTLKFSIDNKCRTDIGPNDFLDFYECVVDGATFPGRRFNSGKVDPFMGVLGTMGATNAMTPQQIVTTLMTPQANCDPVGSEPPPGP